jgi:large subunit ribosomal protein L15
MKLHEISPAKGSKHSKKRAGRGPGSGLGKTSGRGHKGQRSRSGYHQRPGFEGGQMPLVRRVPKRGFTNIFRTEYAVVNLSQLTGLPEEIQEINPDLFVQLGLVRPGRPVKVLGDGEVERAYQVTAHRFSKSARSKIEAAGGRCEELAS